MPWQTAVPDAVALRLYGIPSAAQATGPKGKGRVGWGQGHTGFRGQGRTQSDRNRWREEGRKRNSALSRGGGWGES